MNVREKRFLIKPEEVEQILFADNSDCESDLGLDDEDQGFLDADVDNVGAEIVIEEVEKDLSDQNDVETEAVLGAYISSDRPDRKVTRSKQTPKVRQSVPEHIDDVMESQRSSGKRRNTSMNVIHKGAVFAWRRR
ncbi:hypothetical protein LOTGIDRAFT_157502 [Lottia gigantea]|uniref:Uncharacterized protein n=1 Tax=Lottia gigantea TaxID=225164 RepID=V4AVE7_LOTGI|nr:hypothetical protein LOTGIDRAFT_157502 [Lottia gigantea]ESP01323.1 hypothetical protein LOTGIDRAFT_157502 [Lottia gigantea]